MSMSSCISDARKYDLVIGRGRGGRRRHGCAPEGVEQLGTKTVVYRPVCKRYTQRDCRHREVLWRYQRTQYWPQAPSSATRRGARRWIKRHGGQLELDALSAPPASGAED